MLHAGLIEAGFRCTPPAGAYYIMADFSDLSSQTDVEFAEWLVREMGVASVPGSSFYSRPEDGRTTVRFAFCKTQDLLVDAVQRLRGVQGS